MISKGLALALVVFGCAACTTGNAPPPSLSQADVPIGCPLGVSGAVVSVVNVPNGIVLSFASRDKTDELRERVTDAAAQHGPGTGYGKGHDGVHGTGGEHGLMAYQMPPSRMLAERTEDGARLTIIPNVSSDLETLRAKVRERAAAMSATSCK